MPSNNSWECLGVAYLCQPQVDLYRCKQCGLDTIDPDQPFEPMTAEQLAEVEAVVGKLRQ